MVNNMSPRMIFIYYPWDKYYYCHRFRDKDTEACSVGGQRAVRLGLEPRKSDSRTRTLLDPGNPIPEPELPFSHCPLLFLLLKCF